MEVVPTSVGIASRGWDEQHLDLVAASRQIGGATTTGFTPAVSAVAGRFTTSWERFTNTLGTDCEARAEGLRAAIRDYVGSDEVQGMQLILLMAYLQEQR